MQSNFPKILLFLSITFFIFSCAIFFFFYKAISNNNQKADQATVEWQRQALQRDELKQLDTLIKTIGKEKTLLEAHFAKSSDVVPFLDMVEKLAPKAEAGAEVVSVNVLPENLGLLVGVKASGSFESIFKFLTLLENFPYELEFVSIDVQRKEELDVSKRSVKMPKWEALFTLKLLSFIE